MRTSRPTDSPVFEALVGCAEACRRALTALEDARVDDAAAACLDACARCAEACSALPEAQLAACADACRRCLAAFAEL